MTREEANDILRVTCDMPMQDYFNPEGFFVVWPWMRDDSKHQDQGWTWRDFRIWLITHDNLDPYKVGVEAFIELIDHYRDEGGFVFLCAEWVREKK